MKKGILTALLVLLLTFISVPAAGAAGTETVTMGGNGTALKPYMIENADQLSDFRDLVNKGNHFLHAELTNDIYLEGNSWTPIGLTELGFQGTFDGNGYSIYNLSLDTVSNKILVRASNKNTYSLQVSGLFGVIGVGGTVRRVGIDANVTGSISETSGTAIYIGSLAGENFGTVEECFSRCTFENLSVTNNSYIGIGGLIGNSHGTVVRNCYNTGSISANLAVTPATYSVFAGGLIGLADCRVENCYSAAPMNLTVPQGVLFQGGIIGNGGGSTITNCYYDNQACTVQNSVGCKYNDTKSYDPDGCGGKTKEEIVAQMISGTTGILGTKVFDEDQSGINKGYPTLKIMTYGLESGNVSDWFQKEAMEDSTVSDLVKSLTPSMLANRDLTKDVTREEFAGIAVRLYEKMGGEILDPSQLENPFTDTKSDSIKKAYALGLTNGVTDTTYEPYEVISRQDLATMLSRVYKALNVPGWTLAQDDAFPLDGTGAKPFADDAQISDYAKPAVYFMAKHNIINGISSDTFAPRNTETQEHGTASREQALIMALRMLQNLSE